ncbi:alpha/beta fold hydrolase [Pelagicoccus enzymogenes]|uniref:YheT family hydrolase n=1 Tax=Pelagicoccus enzymogenes TaxID=2773457 RepID=UPI00280E7B49|nr:alpha/beta fold hydrolase [Pelagicoccus enzymogenes]MDQ8196584.1 alpha/beta fold hydrolase [Pelagicoccus enzymogenes]
MPLLDCRPYRCPVLLRGEHMETIVPNLSRRRFSVPYRRERVELADGDFVDLDTAIYEGKESFDTCLLALHGLEGSSTAPYVKSLAKALRRREWDFVAMNMRGCSHELNRALRFYHSGETGDLREVLLFLATRYRRIFLFGFSLGGNVVLKYMGENLGAVSSAVAGAVAVSAPVDLQGSALQIGGPGNRFYMKRFIRLLSQKVEAKAQVYPEELDATGVRELKSFQEFDGRYTAPLNGFASAQDYWRKCSALNWLQDIAVPSLLINARNDPFLSDACFPKEIARTSPALYSVFPDRGGHLGFPGKRRLGCAWHEEVALEFLAGL